MRAGKALGRLCTCRGSSSLCLLAEAVSTKFSYSASILLCLQVITILSVYLSKQYITIRCITVNNASCYQVHFSVSLQSGNLRPVRESSPVCMQGVVLPGGTLIFFLIRELDPASADCTQNVSGISSIPKKYFKSSIPKKIFQFSTLALKNLEMYINDPQNSSVL